MRSWRATGTKKYEKWMGRRQGRRPMGISSRQILAKQFHTPGTLPKAGAADLKASPLPPAPPGLQGAPRAQGAP